MGGSKVIVFPRTFCIFWLTRMPYRLPLRMDDMIARGRKRRIKCYVFTMELWIRPWLL